MSRERVTLDPEDVDAIARDVAARVQRPSLGLATVEQLATELQVDRAWVYRRWRELGGFKLGAGRNAPIRFDLASVRALLRPTASPPPMPTPPVAPRLRSHRAPLPEGVEMLAPRRT
jgi:hypothetical protein